MLFYVVFAAFAAAFSVFDGKARAAKRQLFQIGWDRTMLAIERKNEILRKLRAEQRVLVSELAAYYGVTEETIRRDLDKLEKEGFATKTYGGAILGNSTKTDLSYTIRNKTNVDAKTDRGAGQHADRRR